jgi:hypothetical protein
MPMPKCEEKKVEQKSSRLSGAEIKLKDLFRPREKGKKGEKERRNLRYYCKNLIYSNADWKPFFASPLSSFPIAHLRRGEDSDAREVCNLNFFLFSGAAAASTMMENISQRR